MCTWSPMVVNRVEMVPLLMFCSPTPNRVQSRLPTRAALQYLWPRNVSFSPEGEVRVKLVTILIGSLAIAMIGLKLNMVVLCFLSSNCKKVSNAVMSPVLLVNLNL